MKCELCGGERLATSHDAERVALRKVIAEMSNERLRALIQGVTVAGAKQALALCDSDDERLALIRDMTKGYCLECGGVDPDGKCVCMRDE